jgi:hypothetical protein
MYWKKKRVKYASAHGPDHSTGLTVNFSPGRLSRTPTPALVCIQSLPGVLGFSPPLAARPVECSWPSVPPSLPASLSNCALHARPDDLCPPPLPPLPSPCGVSCVGVRSSETAAALSWRDRPSPTTRALSAPPTTSPTPPKRLPREARRTRARTPPGPAAGAGGGS